MAAPDVRTFGRDPRFPEWCLVCCTKHPPEARCRGEILATGPERYGWKAVVETPSSLEAYGVLVAPAGDLWRARILTFPRSLWTVPGGHGVLKFVANSPQTAEELAIRFIEEHCARRGFTLRNGLEVAEATASRSRTATTIAPRWPLVLPVRFGLDALNLRAVTRNVSEGGVFVQTPAPMDSGLEILMQLILQKTAVSLEGTVMWSRRGSGVGRPPGMGVRLVMPPEAYMKYVRSLPSPAPAEGF